MRRYLVTLLCIAASAPASLAWAQTQQSGQKLSDRRVHYQIDAVLDADRKVVVGRQALTWRNPASTPISEMQFHLYLNGFRDDFSTYMQESGGRFRGMRGNPDERGEITISRLSLDPLGQSMSRSGSADEVDLTDRIVFIQPDDGNPYDASVFSLQLPSPVLPGDSVTLRFEFESTLPRVFARTGWDETESGALFFFVGQWFPKVGVYEVPGQRYVPADAPEGKWNTHQFHANSEFYADFGTYRVSIDVPAPYVVGASGTRVAEDTIGDRKRVVYVANDVHDFAWTASPDFRVYEDEWQHVSITTLMLPEHDRYMGRMTEATKLAMERMDRWVGPYPYNTLTIVDAIGGAVGMEYPTLFTSWSTSYAPRWLRAPIEDTVIHEFIHQYFYGILASNEFEEAWLDEGFTSYFEARVMDDAYGAGSGGRFAGVEVDVSDTHRLAYSRGRPDQGVIYDLPWNQRSGTYGRMAYYKPTVVLASLEKHVGTDRMQEIFHAYYDRWRFRHPTTRDFIRVAEDITSSDLSWFFDQFVYGSAVVDYRVDRIWNRAVQIDDSTAEWESEVILERASDGIFPQTVRVYLADGSQRDFEWDGVQEWYTLSTTGSHRVVMAEVDPNEEVWLDINRLNNRMSVVPQKQFAREIQLAAITLLQHLFLLLAGLL